MTALDIDRLRATPLEQVPYDHVVVPNFVRPEAFGPIVAHFPDVPGPGSHPPSMLAIKGAFADLLAEMDDAPFRAAVEDKFDLDLTDRPTMFTVRGFCRKTDGKIHTDTASKIITVLLYLNQDWDADGGRLRVLRSPENLDDYASEVPPNGGTLLVFRRSASSWHGHEPFEGRRRAVQMNWVTGDDVVTFEQRRHRFSTMMKRLKHGIGLR